MTAPKLTAAQRAVRDGRSVDVKLANGLTTMLTVEATAALMLLNVWDHLSPDMRLASFEHITLIEKGFAETERQSLGYRVFITDAGRAALRGES